MREAAAASVACARRTPRRGRPQMQPTAHATSVDPKYYGEPMSRAAEAPMSLVMSRNNFAAPGL